MRGGSEMIRFFFWVFLFLILLVFPQRVFAGEWVISSYPIYKICKEIFAEESLYLIQPPKGEFHFSEPGPKDWEKIRSAELLLIVGTEPWAKRVYRFQKKENILTLLREDEKPIDPHLWFDLERVEGFVKTLLNHPSVQRKSNYEKYQKRANEFLVRLNALKQGYSELAKCRKKEFYNLGHQVFSYLFKGSPVREVPLIRGHHHGEPGLKVVREVVAKAKERRVTQIVVTERGFLKHKNFFEREGIEVLEVWSGDWDAPGTFLELLEKNLSVFRRILDC